MDSDHRFKRRSPCAGEAHPIRWHGRLPTNKFCLPQSRSDYLLLALVPRCATRARSPSSSQRPPIKKTHERAFGLGLCGTLGRANILDVRSTQWRLPVITRYVAICASALCAAMTLHGTSAYALSMKECSAKYQEAKKAGTLNGLKWNDFRKAQCGAEATAAPEPAPAAAATPPAATSAAKPAAPPVAAPVATGNAVFPSAISPKYSSESAGKARRETCLDQYKANKANNANGGLKWIEKGGGYYSECNKHLKGQG